MISARHELSDAVAEAVGDTLQHFHRELERAWRWGAGTAAEHAAHLSRNMFATRASGPSNASSAA